MVVNDQPYMNNSLAKPNVQQNNVQPNIEAPQLGLVSELPGMNIGSTLRSYFSIILKWWWITLLLSGLIITFTTLWAKRITPEYRAQTTIEIKQQETNILGGQSIDETNANLEFLVTQLALLKSVALAETVVEDLGLQDKPRFAPQTGSREQRVSVASKRFLDKVTATRLRGSRILSISYEDTNPRFAAQAANQLAENFVRFNQERKFNATAYARDFVRERLESIKDELEQSERAYNDYIQNAGILGDGGSDGNFDNEALNILNRDLIASKSKRIELENVFNLAKKGIFVTDVQKNATVNSLESEQNRLEIEYNEKRLLLKPKHPEMLALQSKIDILKGLVEESNSEVMNTLEAQYENSLNIEKEFKNRIATLEHKMVNSQNADFDLNILQREVQTNRAQYDALLQRFKEITVSDGTGADLISIIDEAVIPKKPFSPNIPLIAAVATLLSLLLSALAVIFANAMDDFIKSPDDVRNKLNTMPLGSIPQAKESMADELKDPLSTVSEGYASVRTALSIYLNNKEKFCLQITSTRASEGKSSSSYALSKNFAEAGHKVLLIDADMRKPGFENLTDSIGLSGLLTTPSDLMSQVNQTKVENVSLLPSGVIPTNPVALLANIRFRKLIEEARAQYDIVIIDSPPVLGLADAVLIGGLCDGTIVMLESAAMRTPPITQTLKRLRDGGSNIFGIVLSKYKPSLDRYSDDYYYYSYSTQEYSMKDSKKKNKLGLLGQKTSKKIKWNI